MVGHGGVDLISVQVVPTLLLGGPMCDDCSLYDLFLLGGAGGPGVMLLLENPGLGGM